MKAKVIFGVTFLVFLIIGGIVMFSNNVFYDPPDGAGNYEKPGNEIIGTIKLKKNDDYLKLATVTLDQAYRNFHKKVRNGKVMSITLGEDAGYLIYDIVFIDHKHEKEAKIDAGTGQVLAIDKAEGNASTSEKEGSEKAGEADANLNVKGTIIVKDTQRAQFPYMAGITPLQASQAVQKQFPGKVSKIALENENDFLMYNVLIKTQKKELEVKVDAGTGKVVGREDGSADALQK